MESQVRKYIVSSLHPSRSHSRSDTFSNAHVVTLLGYVITRLDEAAKDYSQQFDSLMSMLREQGEKAGDISRFLALRLDFNEYHEQRMGAPGVVAGSPVAARG